MLLVSERTSRLPACYYLLLTQQHSCRSVDTLLTLTLNKIHALKLTMKPQTIYILVDTLTFNKTHAKFTRNKLSIRSNSNVETSFDRFYVLSMSGICTWIHQQPDTLRQVSPSDSSYAWLCCTFKCTHVFVYVTESKHIHIFAKYWQTSSYFHRYTQQEICNKAIQKDSITP